jgi:hypothetical protein
MINTAKAYLCTEGTIEYRGCGISYYTYSMSDRPSHFKIVVNVELHYTQNNFVKTLNLDDSFDKEDAAINYGIEQGKKFIDQAYEKGKIDVIKSTNPIQPRNDKMGKPKTPEKTRSDKRSSDKR